MKKAIYLLPLFGMLFVFPFAAAAPVEKVEGFVCPVIKTDAVLNSPKGTAIAGGDYTIIGPDVAIPEHATNGDGAGTPGGSHSAPGDTDYTAVWSKGIPA